MTHRSYQLGDRLLVEVSRVDLEERKIDFDLVASLGGPDNKPTRSKKAKRFKAEKSRKSGARPGKRKKTSQYKSR
ncbi:ribonuclease R [bacterium MnTg03]|nr:ribonuclease R [bacterium MnTg03]